MKLAITGTSGFIGGSLYEHFVKKNDVMPIRLRGNMDFQKLEDEIIEYKPEVFISCGWSQGNNFSSTNDNMQFDNIFVGNKLLSILSKLSSLHFVGFGSFAEYGSKNYPISEDAEELPESLYGISKRIHKDVTELFCKQAGFSWAWIRPCFVYGPGDVSTRLISRAVSSCLGGEPLVLDACKSIVDYLYIDDFVEAVNELLSLRAEGIYNVCSGKQYVVYDIVREIQTLCDKHNSISFDDSLERKSFPKYICGDNNKLRAMTGWEPRHSISEGLKKTMEQS